MGAELEDLRERLVAIAEELSDLALDLLREAVGDDGSGASSSASASAASAVALERRLTRARRAVEKAAALLASEDADAELS
jgi:hypothetical protein